jgi:hypothetical protein
VEREKRLTHVFQNHMEAIRRHLHMRPGATTSDRAVFIQQISYSHRARKDNDCTIEQFDLSEIVKICHGLDGETRLAEKISPYTLAHCVNLSQQVATLNVYCE